MMTYMAMLLNTCLIKWIVSEASTTQSHLKCSNRVTPTMNSSKNSWRYWPSVTMPLLPSHIKSISWLGLSAKATRVCSMRKSLSLSSQMPMDSSSRPVRTKCWRFKGKEIWSDTKRSCCKSSKFRTNGLLFKWFSLSKPLRRMLQYTTKQIFA